ncbi:winged helix-turn-helix domain-containing protein [Thalassotalea ganghwensis]
MKKSEYTLETNSYNNHMQASLSLDLQNKRIVDTTGNNLELKSKSFNLLKVLIEHSPSPLSVEQLKKLVWQTEHIGEDTVRQRIKLLRSELKKCHGEDVIKNERSKGYYVQKKDINFAIDNAEEPIQNASSKVIGNQSTHGVRWQIVALVSFTALVLLSLLMINYTSSASNIKLNIASVSPKQGSQQDRAFADGFSFMLSEVLIKLPDIEVFSDKSNTVDATVLIGIGNNSDHSTLVVQLLDIDTQQYLWSKAYPISQDENYYQALAHIAAHVAMMLKTHYDDDLHQSIISGQTKNPASLTAYIFAQGYVKTGNKSLAEKYLDDALRFDPNFEQAQQLKQEILKMQ